MTEGTESGNVQIDLLRHGETDGGARYRSHTDDPLTATGWGQMWAAVERAPAWERIVTSPLKRCAAFAQALAQRLSIPVAIDERWREMDFGAWEGRTAADLMTTDAEALGRFWRDPWHNAPPGGESLAHVQARVFAAWDDIVRQRRPTLVIGHGGPIRLILGRCRGHPADELLAIDVPHAALYRLHGNLVGDGEPIGQAEAR